MRIPLAEAVASKIGPPTPTGCLLWMGDRNEQGYGRICSRGSKKILVAHRVVWELTNGPIPDGMEVCHNCPEGDNPACVNLAHLFLGTHAQNMADAASKGRMAQGEASPRAKLTAEKVREARRRYKAGGVSIRSLSREYSVHHSSLSSAIFGRSWKSIG